ncbi:MAG: membrane protein insertase YidC [Treponema sp.]|jgi:YidC/Oxa1 family membrane protein insertase|nr:membrane protein insertase YidC [Treponema sp.]
MEKRTLLAVVLSVVVIAGYYIIQGIFFPPREPARGVSSGEQSLVDETSTAVADTGSPFAEILPESGEVLGVEEPAPDALAEERVIIDTTLMKVILSNAGGDVVSYKLKKHNDRDDFVEMVLPGNKESHAFTVAFGNISTQPLSSYFTVKRLSEYSVEFYRDFVIPGTGTKTIAGNDVPNGTDGGSGSRFRLTKRYDFKPDEYMFELAITLDGAYSVSSFNFSGVAYTLGFGPQIGPKFEKLDQRYEYRHYYTYANGKQKQEKVNANNPAIIANRPTWAAITGKYFTFIALPYTNQYELVFSAQPEPGIPDASRLYIIRPSSNTSRFEDIYRFYLGPKNQESLMIYNNGNNSYNIRDMELIKVANTSGFLGPLETGLKWLLMMFYRIIPNYGVAIILLTLLVKLILFPLTKKGSESTLRMQSLSPKIKEIQEKYKDNPTQMNTKMAELYKQEGYNPLAGCLPMILQIPIFFAMYNLFNNHFDLRGAMFIPVWIPDLSLPESVWNFAPFRIPLLGWSNIRLLPFIYVGSQLLFGKVTQTPDQQGNAQMKMMLYAMPIIFFFMLYDVPSGLLVYWILSNLLSMVQQLAINKYLARRRASMAASNPEPVIAPKKKKKRR